MKIALIIFTRNELKNSKYIYNKIPFNLVDRTYVIDGNSTDGTKEFWLRKNIKVFNQKYRGVGGAYHSAFENTKEYGLIFFHPDGNMDPKDIRKFVNELNQRKGFIVATRMIKGARNEDDGKFFKPRKWFCQFLAFMANARWGREDNRTTDVTQGYRAFNRETFKELGINKPNSIAPDYEQVIRALKKNIKINEFPTFENKRKYGETSMGSIKTGVENLKVFLNELMN